MGREDFCALGHAGKWWNPNFLALAPRTGTSAVESVCVPQATKDWHLVRLESVVIPSKVSFGHSQVWLRKCGWHMENYPKCPQLHTLHPSSLWGYVLPRSEQDPACSGGFANFSLAGSDSWSWVEAWSCLCCCTWSDGTRSFVTSVPTACNSQATFQHKIWARELLGWRSLSPAPTSFLWLCFGSA